MSTGYRCPLVDATKDNHGVDEFVVSRNICAESCIGICVAVAPADSLAVSLELRADAQDFD